MSNLNEKTNENSKVTVVCEACRRSFEADADSPAAFCVHCGTRQTVAPAEAARLREQSGEAGHEQMFWRNRLIKTTDPDERLALIDAAGPILDPAIQAVYRQFWQARFKPSRVKELRWADSWLGFLQQLLTLTREDNRRRVRKKTGREIRSFFDQQALRQALNNAELPAGDRMGAVWPDPVHILYEELTGVVYLYADLCLQDKQYGSVLFGFGRKKEPQIEAMIAGELQKVRTGAIWSQEPLLPGSAVLAQALTDGFRLRLEPAFVIR